MNQKVTNSSTETADTSVTTVQSSKPLLSSPTKPKKNPLVSQSMNLPNEEIENAPQKLISSRNSARARRVTINPRGTCTAHARTITLVKARLPRRLLFAPRATPWLYCIAAREIEASQSVSASAATCRDYIGNLCSARNSGSRRDTRASALFFLFFLSRESRGKGPPSFPCAPSARAEGFKGFSRRRPGDTALIVYDA